MDNKQRLQHNQLPLYACASICEGISAMHDSWKIWQLAEYNRQIKLHAPKFYTYIYIFMEIVH